MRDRARDVDDGKERDHDGRRLEPGTFSSFFTLTFFTYQYYLLILILWQERRKCRSDGAKLPRWLPTSPRTTRKKKGPPESAATCVETSKMEKKPI